jgi:hypothetical protein
MGRPARGPAAAVASGPGPAAAAGSVGSVSEPRTAASAIPSAMQWWMRATSTSPAPETGRGCSCHGECARSSGSLTSRATSAGSSDAPARRSTATCRPRSNAASSAHAGRRRPAAHDALPELRVPAGHPVPNEVAQDVPVHPPASRSTAVTVSRLSRASSPSQAASRPDMGGGPVHSRR